MQEEINVWLVEGLHNPGINIINIKKWMKKVIRRAVGASSSNSNSWVGINK